MKAHNGLITLEDLKNYTPKERQPLKGKYRGYEIISMPPPSSGGIVLLQVLQMLEKYDIKKDGIQFGGKNSSCLLKPNAAVLPTAPNIWLIPILQMFPDNSFWTKIT